MAPRRDDPALGRLHFQRAPPRNSTNQPRSRGMRTVMLECWPRGERPRCYIRILKRYSTRSGTRQPNAVPDAPTAGQSTAGKAKGGRSQAPKAQGTRGHASSATTASTQAPTGKKHGPTEQGTMPQPGEAAEQV
ncbi:hypothetical protein EIP86_010010 [Pleurotus ostreatoroseus]|nr:hypothetical protein EIP86_010010 [Pleurotus ostreatoroseus]